MNHPHWTPRKHKQITIFAAVHVWNEKSRESISSTFSFQSWFWKRTFSDSQLLQILNKNRPIFSIFIELCITTNKFSFEIMSPFRQLFTARQTAHPPSPTGVPTTQLNMEESLCEGVVKLGDTYCETSVCTTPSSSADPIKWINHFPNEFINFLMNFPNLLKFLIFLIIFIYHFTFIHPFIYALVPPSRCYSGMEMNEFATCPHAWCTTSSSVSFSQQRTGNHTRALIRGQCKLWTREDVKAGLIWELKE